MDVIRAQSILIIPQQTSSPAVLLSAKALGKVLMAQNKNVDYFLVKTLAESSDIITTPENIVNETRSKNVLLLTLSKIQSKITSLDWIQNEDKLEITVKSDHGEIGSPDLSISHTLVNYDLRIFIETNKEVIEKLTGVEDNTIFSGTSVFLENRDQLSIPAINVFNFIIKTKYAIDSEVAMLLFSSLRESTNNFKDKISSEVFAIAAELLKITEKEVVNGEVGNSLVQPAPVQTVKPVVEKKIEKKTDNTAPKVPTENKPDIISYATPEVLPPDFDPLSPATEIPEPIKLENEIVTPPIQPNTPLPQAT